jgi:hypothetical protein
VKAIDWQRYDELKGQGLSGRQIAEELGIAESTLRGLVKRRQVQVPEGTRGTPGTQGTPARRKTARIDRVPAGTQETQAPSSELHALVNALMPLLVAEVEKHLDQRVPQVPQAEPPPPVQGRPKGIPGYPEHPEKDTRFNMHIPAGERWELYAVAKGLGLDPSLLLRQVWQAFMATPRAQEALQRALPFMGTQGYPQGTLPSHTEEQNS